MALRLDIEGIQKAKEVITNLGGRLWIVDQGFQYKGRLIHYLSVVEENGVAKLKFIHVISDFYIKELHPKTKQVNDIIKYINEKYK